MRSSAKLNFLDQGDSLTYRSLHELTLLNGDTFLWEALFHELSPFKSHRSLLVSPIMSGPRSLSLVSIDCRSNTNVS